MASLKVSFLLLRNTSAIATIEVGNGLKLFKERTSLTTRLHSFPFRVVNDWSTLPELVANPTNVLILKALLNEHWQYY